MSRAPPGGRLGLPGSNPRATFRGDENSESWKAPSPGPRSPETPRYGKKPLPPVAQAGGSARQVPLQIAKVSDPTLRSRFIYENICAVAPEDFPPIRDGTDHYILLRGGKPPGEYVVTGRPVPGFPPGCISLSDPQRTWCGITLRDQLTGSIYDPFSSGHKAYLGTIDLEIGFASPNKKTDASFDESELSKIFLDIYQNQILAPGQRLVMDVRNMPLLIVVKTVGLVDLSMAPDGSINQVHREANTRAILTHLTQVQFRRDPKGDFNLKSSDSKPNSNAILAPDFKFEDMGIGGLGDEFTSICRRAFASRLLPPGLVAKMGIPHVKGMLLYGPPGTGKTLMARQFGKMLNAQPPKVINGPEVLNKYVGQSEENIRKLFADAEKEYKEKGNESSLHIIIFDELDAVCKQRGSGAGGGTGVGDNVVTQLLSKLDGVDQLNNILIIGMTNRKDLIDDALLRPGRFELHLEISLPDEQGRLEILTIRTGDMRANGYLDSDVDLAKLAALTKNFSGAEIDGLVKAAAAWVFSRHINIGQGPVVHDIENLKVTHEDFVRALGDITPAYGVSEDKLEQAIGQGIIPYSAKVDDIFQEMKDVVSMVKDHTAKSSTSVLFYGPKGSGKTCLAAHIAKRSDFPFVKMITPFDLVRYRDDFAKKDYIDGAFADAYKSPVSLLILDDFERLIGWNPVGPRFSNTLLETFKTLVVSEPPKGHRLLVFVTTSKPSVLEMLEIYNDFEKKIDVPAVANFRELRIVLERRNIFNTEDINEVINIMQQRMGTDYVGVGIKSILNCVYEVEAGSQDSDRLSTFAKLLLEKIREMQA
ncbi:hypothetical protein CDD81_6154 [Ophiocordyceps australis]|uniref:Vesicular-fusion protein SEC18 n=1 Tax=Ophiocordyceps australis TaxID=1399860 RepID=A0A2C5Y3L7_9HYPO|nr:hypothetical protein CDD81_6154 [Ophiocordyceps australis]